MLLPPGLACLAPIWGLLGALAGSSAMLRQYKAINHVLVIASLPAQILVSLLNELNHSRGMFYTKVLLALIVAKSVTGFFVAKVVANLDNPTFIKNARKLREWL
jgi:hypothetical protein